MIIIFEIFHFWLGILQNRILQIILTKSRSGGAIISEIRSITDALIEGVDVKMVGTLQNIGTFIYVGTSFTACKNLIYFKGTCLPSMSLQKSHPVRTLLWSGHELTVKSKISCEAKCHSKANGKDDEKLHFEPKVSVF